jgi:hypothetical protein
MHREEVGDALAILASFHLVLAVRIMQYGSMAVAAVLAPVEFMRT